jgi:hypothetical protein
VTKLVEWKYAISTAKQPVETTPAKAGITIAVHRHRPSLARQWASLTGPGWGNQPPRAGRLATGTLKTRSVPAAVPRLLDQ